MGKQDEYNSFLKELFEDTSKAIVASELGQIVANKFDVKKAYARIIIKRAVDSGLIKSSNPISFGKGQFVYFHNKFRLDIRKLKEISKKHRPPLYRLLDVLEINNGIISFYEALKVVASPLDKSKTKQSNLTDTIGILKQLNMAEIIADSRNIKYIIFSDVIDNKKVLVEKQYANMVLDSTFIPDILRWLGKINLIDNSRVIYRNKKEPALGARKNNLVWDAFSFTKTTGINTVFKSNKEKNDLAVVVLEVIISRKLVESDIQGLYSRVQNVINSVKEEKTKRKILPIVIYKDISTEAFLKMKALGFLNFSLGTIYGDKIYEIITNIKTINLMKTQDIDDLILSNKFLYKIREVLSKIDDTGQNNNLQNLKGDMFESLMYIMIKDIYSDADIQQ